MIGHGARNRIPIEVQDRLAAGRQSEPVELSLNFPDFRPARNGIAITDEAGRIVLSQLVAATETKDGTVRSATVCFPVDIAPGRQSARYHVWLSDRPLPLAEGGMEQLPTRLVDGFRRLRNGYYELELCVGTAEGHGGSKWGIRHFEHCDQALNLIAGNRNAFGGVYGPFFTPENGLVNPPAHAIAAFEPITEGPVTCQYRMTVEVPAGLRPELENKTIEVIWRFYAGTPCFTRSYFVDDYETTIDGRPCQNRITVGDEIESGKSNLMLSTYRHHDGTGYRAGDLYAEILLERFRDLEKREPAIVARAMDRLGIDPAEDPAAWHWDNYWRLFCVIEGALPRDTLEKEVDLIWKSANDVVWSDRDHNMVRFSDDAVDVNDVPQQTIFALNAQKTCEFSPATGYSFLRYVNRPIPRMQIVQRYDSGWVNWGTNGENEYPELPSGSTIWSAYGRFADWRDELQKMEVPLGIGARPMERMYDWST